MNFEFSDGAREIGAEARKVLEGRNARVGARQVLNGATAYDSELWSLVASLGWLGAAIPEADGGWGGDHEALCQVAQEIGRAGAAMPFSSSVYFAITAIQQYGSVAQKKQYLPDLVSGKSIGTFCLAEERGDPQQSAVEATVTDGLLSGTKWPVPDGMIADLGIVVAKDSDSDIYSTGLYVVRLNGPGVSRKRLDSIDPTREIAHVEFKAVHAERLAAAPRGGLAVDALLNQAAVLLAFEQIGGAQACLDMAVEYARNRYAFGRPIGSLQAIKHKLADIYVAVELARSNAYFAAWALSNGAPELAIAAATARVSACDAFHLAATENIQTHGGFGVTWDADCHLYLRRSEWLALVVGSSRSWKEQIMTELTRHPEYVAD